MPSPARIRTTIAAVVDQPEELRALRVFHKALADVNRLRMVQRLAAGPATVTDLIEEVGLSQPLVSWHLARLRAAGIVLTQRVGRETRCTLRPEAWEEVAARERRLIGADGSGHGAADGGPTVAGRPDEQRLAVIPAGGPVLERAEG
ncbi:MAG TPA: metalloregulator ArsR/SmtB family transcription factor [Candidatus Limnocylindrales bacterium]